MPLRHKHKKAARIARKQGFAAVLPRHTALFYQRGGTLVVGFDNMKSRDQPAPAFPWGYQALANAGHSHLGIMMARRNDWFRAPGLVQFFDTLQTDGFFEQFERVVFFGSSMGGYGALSFSAFCPGADVVTFAPQTSLDPQVVPFESRYRLGFSRGVWSGPHVDGARAVRSARRVIVFADPHHFLDAAHVRRLPRRNLTWIRCPNFGHNPARLLKQMDLLGPVLRRAWTGHFHAADVHLHMRAARRTTQAHARLVLQRAINTGHADLALRVAQNLQRANPNWNFPKIVAKAQKHSRSSIRAVA